MYPRQRASRCETFTSHTIEAMSARPTLRRGIPRRFWVPLALFLLGLWLTRHAWGGVAPEGDDLPYHLSRAQFGWSTVFRSLHLDGWIPRFGAGSQAFLLYGPGLSMAFSVVKLLSFGQLDDATVMTSIMTVSFAAAGPGVWFVARSLRLSALTSGLAGLIGLCVSVPFGVGIAGTFDLGLVANQMAVPLYCLSLGLVLRIAGAHLGDAVDLATPARRWGRVLLAGITIMALLVTHPATTVMFALTGLVVLPVVLVRRHTPLSRPILDLAITAGVATIASAWWLLPIAVHHAPRAPSADWSTPPMWTRVGDVVNGRVMFSPQIAALVTVAVAVLLAQLTSRRARVWRQALGPGLVLAPLAVFLLGYWLHGRFGTEADAANLIPNRGLGFVGLLLALPTAQFLSAAADSLVRSKQLAALLLPLAAAIVAVNPSLIPASATARNVPALPASITEVATALHDDMPPWSRFVFAQRDDFRTSFGIVHPELWIAYDAERNTVTDLGGNAVSAFDNYLQDHIFDGTFDDVPGRLAAAGVTHLLVGPSDLSFMARPEWSAWQPVWNGAGTTIFRHSSPAGQPTADAQIVVDRPVDVTLRRYSPERLVWTARNAPAFTAVFAIAAFPKWHVTADGRDVPTSVSADGLLRAAVPAGTTTIEAEFVRDWADYLGVAITGLGLLFVAGTWVRGQRRGRSPEHPYDDEHDDERNAADGALGPVDELEPVER